MERTVHILVVEDNDDDVAILRRLVARLDGDFELTVATTGTEALEILRCQTPDFALIDQNLPDLSGDLLIRRARALREGLPIVMLTGQGDERLAVQVMKAGAYDYLRKGDLSEHGLARVINNVLERSRLETEVRAAEARLRDWAIRDGLTGLYNHRHFQEVLRRDFASARRYGRPLCALMLDLDHFKRVNDVHGHLTGDAVLRGVAQRLQAVAREVDVIARYGGEEFVLLLPNTDAEGAMQLAERLRTQIGGSPIVHDGLSIDVTVSIGVSCSLDPDAKDGRALLALADKALFSAKLGGRNRLMRAGRHSPVNTAELPIIVADEVEFEARRRVVSALSAVTRLADAKAGRHDPAQIANMAVAFGTHLALDTAQLEVLRASTLLRDIGRVAVSDTIWSKREALTEVERAAIQAHPVRGAEVLELTGLLTSEARIVRHHHERWDGSGYPDGLAGAQIPRLSRIVALVDGFDGLTCERPWRLGLSERQALLSLRDESGRRFDPNLVDAFVQFAEARGTQ